MIKTFHSQRGSAHVVVIIGLIIALTAALGFVFWQNFIRTEPLTENKVAVNTEDKAQKSADPYENWKTYTSDRDGYSIKYPSDWFLAAETQNDGPYIRNFDPENSSEGPRDGEYSGYPKGAKYVRVLLDSGEGAVRTGSSPSENLTIKQWYDALGKSTVNANAITHSTEDVKDLTVNGMEAKSAKSSFTETNENIYLLNGTSLYNLSLYPYGSSADDEIKLILDSFTYL